MNNGLISISDKIRQIKEAVETSSYTQKEIQDIKNEVMQNINLFADYFNIVVRMEILASSISWAPTAGAIYKQMDEERRFRHDLCVRACCSLNEISRSLGLSDFFPGNIEDRHDVASFCGVVVSTLFLHGIHEERSFDTLVSTYAEKGVYAPATQLTEEDLGL